MEVKRLRSLAIEIYKTLNHLNPKYMFEIFKPSENRSSERFKHNIVSQRFKQVKFGKNSINFGNPFQTKLNLFLHWSLLRIL